MHRRLGLDLLALGVGLVEGVQLKGRHGLRYRAHAS